MQDHNPWTSSGVAAGIDMAAALLADVVGSEEAAAICRRVEYEPHEDADRDPFAADGAS